MRVEETGETIGPSITHAMATSTPEEGLVGEAVDIGNGDPEAYLDADVHGKIAIVEGMGMAMPPIVARAEEHGCLATICISSDNYLHQMIVSTVWGNPTPETAGLLPKTPTVSVCANAVRHIILVLPLIVAVAQPACHTPVWDERLVPRGRVRRRYNPRRNRERWARRQVYLVQQLDCAPPGLLV